jgi:hypothetical protein
MVTIGMRLFLIFVESCILVAACIFASWSILVLAYAQVFQAPLNLSNGIADSHEPQIAISGKNIYIIWTGFGSGAEDQDDIFFKKSSNGGANFSGTLNLSKNIGSSFNPKIAVSGKNVYVIWQDDTGNTGNISIFFQKSSDSGTTFSQTINLSNDTGFATDPQLSLFGSTIHMIWRDDTPGPDETFYKRSINSGNSFSESLNISKSVDIDSINGKVYAIASRVYIVWTEGNFDEGRTSILARGSSDNGATFSQAINMGNNSEFADNARVSAFGNNEYILWMQGKFNQGKILFKKSSDGGATFGQTIRLSDSNDTSFNPLLLASDGNVYAVWTSNETNKVNVYSRTSLDDGTTFENVKNLSHGTFGVSNPAIAGNKSTIYVVWEEESPEGSNIAIRKSNDAGASFSHSINLSKSSDYSSYPAISVYDNKSYVVWQDNVNGMDQIRFTREN